MTEHKSYEVKEWMANKIAEELRQNIDMCTVFAVIKETEKAVYAMLNLGVNEKRCHWIPKSALEEYEVGEDEETGAFHHETIFNEDYGECVQLFKEYWEQYI